MPDEHLWRVNALTAAYAWQEVRAIALGVTQAAQEFQAAVWHLEAEQRTDHGSSAWQSVMDARTKLRTEIRRLGDRANAELEGG